MDIGQETMNTRKCCHLQEQRNKPCGSHSSILHQDMHQIKKESSTPPRPQSERIKGSNKLVQTKDIAGSFSYLEELAIVEEQRKQKERKDLELEYLQQEVNRERWRNLHFITLNQCLSKPWVSSYFKNIPLRIYCLPLGNRPQVKKKRTR
ncbi:uncharacterized protein LOC143773712 [Ranitomeya variabilis]|uniref:uncharacterized protein LOC143773712 n=1 Tax=Ranitomeya variabilis TaxID=490064 RepID=UPI00405788A9